MSGGGSADSGGGVGASGLHTGPDLFTKARSMESGTGEGYPTYKSALREAWGDWLLMSECDFIVAVAGPVVSGTSAFARTAAERGMRVNSTYIRRPQDGPGGPVAGGECTAASPYY